MMSLLLKLQQEEANKNYQKYCEIADEFLCSDKSLAPPILKWQIQARRDFYRSNFLDEFLKRFQVSDIINKVDSDVVQVLKRCCPRLTDVIRLPENYDESIVLEELSENRNEPLDAAITKCKELKIYWGNECKDPDAHIYYFQSLLEAEFKIIPLRCLISREEGHEGRYDLLELDNEFMPLFIVHFNKLARVIDSVKCIPFPSALRGACHYVELVNSCSEYSGMAAVDKFIKNFIGRKDDLKIRKISITPENNDMGLVYSNEDFRRWINVVHGIKITNETAFDHDNVLVLPGNSYPTISLVINGFSSSTIQRSFESANILIVDDVSCEPLYKLSVKYPLQPSEEYFGKDIVFPLIRSESKIFQTESVLSILQSTSDSHLALHPPRNPISNFPEHDDSIGHESAEILVIIRLTEASDLTEEFLLALAQQTNVNLCRFVFLVSSNQEDQIKAKYKTISVKWNLNIKASYNCDVGYLRKLMKQISNVLVINQYIILQDPNTLRILADNLKRYPSFSSGCMLSHLQSAQRQQLFFNTSAGLYLSLNSYSDTGLIKMEAKNIMKTLPPSEIYVVSNHFDLGLYSSQLLLSDQFDQNDINNLEVFLIKASCKALLNGTYNVCSTKVSANYLRSPTLNMSLTLDAKTSQSIIDNLPRLLNDITSFSNLLP
tara:strand:- start:431 stop:2419 length:1989 start_codon:yes stop_codon:yes gene_type:complete